MDEFGRNELHYAVIDRELAQISELLNSEVDVNIQDTNGWTALHFACQKDDLETCKLLLDKGADVNIKDSESNTPLFRATFECKNNSGELIKFLIENGAKPDEQNNHGVSPMQLAEQIANYDIVQHFN